MDGQGRIQWAASWLRGVRMLVLIGMLGVGALPMAQVHAATTTVACSSDDLIAALTTVNHNGQPDTLELAAECTYTLTVVDNETDGPNGLPSIVDDAGHGIVIEGNGATIERSNDDTVPAFRIFHVAEGGVLELHQVTIQYGETSAVPMEDANVPVETRYGGGIYAHGTLHLVGSTVQHNQAPYGGEGGGIYTMTQATIVDSTIRDNVAPFWGSNDSRGAGIANLGELMVTNSTIERNTASVYGGGIDNRGALTLAHSQVRDNSAAYGGGVAHQSEHSALITETHFEENTSYGRFGSALWVHQGMATVEHSTVVVAPRYNGIGVDEGTVVITDTLIQGQDGRPGSYSSGQIGIQSTGMVELHRSVIRYQRQAIVNDGGSVIVSESRLEDNWDTSEGGSALYNTESGTAQILDSSVFRNESGQARDPGSVLYNEGWLTVTRSVIQENTAWGYGTIANFGTMMLTDSVLSTNSGWSSGVWNAGTMQIVNSTVSHSLWWEITNDGGELTLLHSTVTGTPTIPLRDGIVNRGGTVRLRATLISMQQDKVGCNGPIQSNGYNMDSDGSCQLTQPTDQSNVDPRLEPLAENGGSTPTHALQVTSPAIDAIPADQCVLDTDQRGVARPQGQGCDIGAYERVPLDAFAQPNGPLSDAWIGFEGRGGYQIIDEQVDVVGGGPIYWQDQAFGTSQEVAVTIMQPDPVGQEQNLLLKVQGEPPDWRNGVIEVLYDVETASVRVETFRPEGGWIVYPGTPLALEDGDRLGARVDAVGSVQLYHNGALIETVTLNTADQDFFNTRGGSIGMWYINAGGAVLDDFDGGTVEP